MMVYLAVHREAVFSCLAGVPIFFLKKGKQSNNMKNCGLELPDFTTRSKFFQNKIPQIFQWQQGVCLYTAVAGWGVFFFCGDFQLTRGYKPDTVALGNNWSPGC